jgi:hypothetical protein
MKGTIMTRQQRDERSTTAIPAQTAADLEDFAAELTVAAFPVILRHGAGLDWLDRELQLWHAMVRTVNQWEQHPVRPLAE